TQEIHNFSCAMLAAGYGPYDPKCFCSRCDCVGQRGVRRLKGQIVLAGEKAQHRSALVRDVIADGPAQHRIAGLGGVEARGPPCGTHHLKRHLRADVREGSEVGRKNASDHDRVWPSTDRTAGRSRTMADQLSPASGDTYTCPPVVPK